MRIRIKILEKEIYYDNVTDFIMTNDVLIIGQDTGKQTYIDIKENDIDDVEIQYIKV